MITLMIFHEVDDVEHWLASPKREELFGPLGIKVRPALPTDHAQGLESDGVRPDTILAARGGVAASVRGRDGGVVPTLSPTRSGTTFDDTRT